MNLAFTINAGETIELRDPATGDIMVIHFTDEGVIVDVYDESRAELSFTSAATYMELREMSYTNAGDGA